MPRDPFPRSPGSYWHALSFVGAIAAACGSVPDRTALPAELILEARIPGIPEARAWGDEVPSHLGSLASVSDDEFLADRTGIVDVEHHYLAVSGGGENGAFGAGLLCGWTAAGTRPEFTMVTGISTGGIIAPFAFLGPRYDDVLREVFTTYRTEDLVEPRGTLEILGSDAFASTEPLARMIAKYMDQAMLDEIAAQHAIGRRLFIGTTNLDANRPVIWDIGRIASSGAPNALELFQKVVLASASIPIAFPPVYFEVEANGARYDEMHVDGGASAQVFLVPIGVDISAIAERLRVRGTPAAYVIRNAKLTPQYETVDPGLAGIAGRTITSMIRTQGIGDLYRIYLQTAAEGVDFHLASIPTDFDHPMSEPFDPEYMGALFDRGFEMAEKGSPWVDVPPGLAEPEPRDG